MKNLKIVLILMLLSIMSLATLNAAELQLGEEPCDGLSPSIAWDGPYAVAVSIGGKIFVVETYKKYDANGVVEVQVTGLAQIGGGTATMAELLEAKRRAYIVMWNLFPGGGGFSAIHSAFTTERSCWQQIVADPFEPDHISVNYSDLIFSISDIVVVNFLNLNPPVSNVYTFNVIQQWKPCTGSICCTAIMHLTFDEINHEIIGARFGGMRVESEEDCSNYIYLSCVANCQNLDWTWSLTEGFSKLAFNNEMNFLPLEISPNPSDGLFKLGFSDDFDGEFEVKINDNLGHLISTFKFNKSAGKFNTELDLQSYSKGFYNISIELDDVKFSQKIIIK